MVILKASQTKLNAIIRTSAMLSLAQLPTSKWLPKSSRFQVISLFLVLRTVSSLLNVSWRRFFAKIDEDFSNSKFDVKAPDYALQESTSKPGNTDTGNYVLKKLFKCNDTHSNFIFNQSVELRIGGFDDVMDNLELNLQTNSSWWRTVSRWHAKRLWPSVGNFKPQHTNAGPILKTLRNLNFRFRREFFE